ncbi:MAG: KH domain-containing protein [Candidatus Sungbacteria bacterium]|uniref:RNA-binding protein KhpA n=1 Tax=Candidatus Sungiibacteriota bacterium TaxID=2750080 RepID=A0A931SCT0_9BACT|nr:KH domain-containing protein [Candidatus Sungbacteria bacterium]
MESDQAFLEYVVKALVDDPSAVTVERKVDEMGVLLTLHVAQPDMGKLIGRNGATAKAIRTLLRVVGIKNNARVNLKIAEPEGSTHPAAMRSERGEVRNEKNRDLDELVDELGSI